MNTIIASVAFAATVSAVNLQYAEPVHGWNDHTEFYAESTVEDAKADIETEFNAGGELIKGAMSDLTEALNTLNTDSAAHLTSHMNAWDSLTG